MKEPYRERDRVKTAIGVQCQSLDQILIEDKLPAPNLIKLDIEGAELEAIEHADQLCGEVRPILILELHNRECDLRA